MDDSQMSIFDLLDENSTEAAAEEAAQESEERREAERRELINHVAAATVNTLRDKVAWVLNHYPDARNSDITLQLRFWEAFQPDVYTGRSIAPEDLYRLTRLTSLARERARIQNQYRLFLASPEVRRHRGTLEEEEREKAQEDIPHAPALVAYMDESGKDAEYLIVGSVWFPQGGYPLFVLLRKLLAFKERIGFSGEFHFSKMGRGDVDAYKGLIEFVLRELSTMSLKLISVPTSGIRQKQDAFHQLFYHLIVSGIEHEDETGRAPLPRRLQIWKDAEEAGADGLLVAHLDDRLRQAAESRFGKQLHVDQIHCADSRENPFLQIADLFAGSANRLLNSPGAGRNYKDEFAEFFLRSAGMDLAFPPNDQTDDLAVHIAL